MQCFDYILYRRKQTFKIVFDKLLEMVRFHFKNLNGKSCKCFDYFVCAEFKMIYKNAWFIVN